jgi:prepilin-type processing-associated H-X9-DG protein
MNDLKQMGLALFMYAQDHDGRFADALEDIESYLASPSILESPRKPDDFDGPSYIYIAGQTTTMSPANVLVYENPEFCDDRITVLFLDGHVEAMSPDAFVEAVEATYERLGRPVPQIDDEAEEEEELEEPEEESEPDDV